MKKPMVYLRAPVFATDLAEREEPTFIFSGAPPVDTNCDCDATLGTRVPVRTHTSNAGGRRRSSLSSRFLLGLHCFLVLSSLATRGHCITFRVKAANNDIRGHGKG